MIGFLSSGVGGVGGAVGRGVVAGIGMAVKKADFGFGGEKVVINKRNGEVACGGAEVVSLQFPAVFGVLFYMGVQVIRKGKDCLRV